MNEKIKICFISVFAYPLFNPAFKTAFGGGGAEVQMSLLAKELARDDGFDVSFVVLDWGQPKEEEIEGVALHAAYRRGRGLANLVRAPWQLFRTLFKIDPEIVVCRAAGVEVGLAGLYCRLFGKKFIYSLAAVMDLNGESFRGFRGKIFRLGLQLSHGFIAQSDDQLKMLEKYPSLRKKKTALIKNSFPIKEASLGGKRETILWVGRCSSEKRPEIFLDLAKNFPSEKFVMIAPPNKPALWEKISLSAKAIPNLTFIASVPFSEINAYFKRAKMLVNTSTSEGFPNTFLQAAENGAAILSLNANPDNFLVNYQAGIFCADDQERLKKSLADILADEDQRKKMAVNAFRYLEENHSLERNAEKWKNFFKNIYE